MFGTFMCNGIFLLSITDIHSSSTSLNEWMSFVKFSQGVALGLHFDRHKFEFMEYAKYLHLMAQLNLLLLPACLPLKRFLCVILLFMHHQSMWYSINCFLFYWQCFFFCSSSAHIVAAGCIDCVANNISDSSSEYSRCS